MQYSITWAQIQEKPQDILQFPIKRHAPPGKILQAARKGALFGAFVGCLLAVAWTLAIGLDRATWGRAFAVVLAGLTTGLILAMARHRRP